MRENFDVVVIGGGTTGTAAIRDLVLRGYTNSVLLERDDLAAGTSGGCHSALHGGSRYVVTDKQTAVECLQENKVFREIVPQVVDPTDAMWVAKTEEQLEFAKKWMENADEIGLPYEVITPEEAIQDEPLLADDIQFALRTIDTGFDPFRLCIAQAYDAKVKGAVIRTHSEVIDLIMEADTVKGVKVLDRKNGTIYEICAKIVVNAAGPWGSRVTEMAGFKIPVNPNKGTMGVYNMRPTKTLIGILRVPSDGDGLVSMGYQNTSLLGTSSVDIEDPDAAVPGLDEIELMESSVEQIIPDIRNARMLRMCTGVRPLYSTTSETGRAVSRRMILIDHAEEHGIEGIVTITGGKYATARLMAEETVDLVCRKLGSDAECTTHKRLIYGAQTKEEAEKDAKYIHEKYKVPLYSAHKMTARYGSRAKEIVDAAPEYSGVICECAQVIGSEVINAFQNEEVFNIKDLRRRIRNGMGTCQGTFCTYKVAALYQKAVHATAQEAHDQLAEYMQERWKGIYYTLQYGDQLAQAEIMQAFYVTQGSYDLLDTKPTEVIPHE